MFALGIILYEMATGERPFGGDTFAEVASSILKDTPVSVTERKADLPRDLGKLIRHCLEKEPRKRFQSTLDLANEPEELRREVDTGEALSAAGAPIATRYAGGRRRAWLVGGAVVAALALAVGSLLLSRNARPPAALLELTPFTSDGGAKQDPALSPDGDTVAYSWFRAPDESFDIYGKSLGPGAKPLRPSEDPHPDLRPAWSPDGRQIAFVRHLDEGPAIYTVPWPSGQERRLIRLTGPTLGWGSSTTLSWSPDGEWLAFAEKPSEDEPSRIVRLALGTLQRQPLTSPPQDSEGEFHPLYSPDGSQLAFVRSGKALGGRDVWVQPLEGGEARRVTFEGYGWCWTSSWTPGGREVLFSVYPPFRLLRVSVAGGDPQLIPGVGKGAASASLWQDRLVYEQRNIPPLDIWRLPGRGASLPDPSPTKLIGSSEDDFQPAFSPDGRRIAFGSARGGVSNIWVCDSDGSDPLQLTTFDRPTGTPRWSPDGRRLVFDSQEAGDWNLYVIDADGGVPRRLTLEPSTDQIGAWSPDGSWIYFTSDQSGESQIWKVPPEGGRAVQVTRNGCGLGPEVSWDGRSLYCRGGSVVWRVPVNAAERAEAVLERDDLAFWALGRSGIYFALWGTNGGDTIRYRDFESGQVPEQYRLEGGLSLWGLTVSRDKQWILYDARLGGGSELVLVENFR